MERSEYEESMFNALTALNSLLQTKEMMTDDKAVIKVNRFRKWLSEKIENPQVDNK